MDLLLFRQFSVPAILVAALLCQSANAQVQAPCCGVIEIFPTAQWCPPQIRSAHPHGISTVVPSAQTCCDGFPAPIYEPVVPPPVVYNQPFLYTTPQQFPTAQGLNGCPAVCCPPGFCNKPSCLQKTFSTYPDVYGRQRLLPLRADLALDRGHELPLPLGVQTAWAHVQADPFVNHVLVGFNGSDPTIVAPVSVDNIENDTTILVSRIDAWVLPFLNVYGIVGETEIDSATNIVVPNPVPPGADIRVPIRFKAAGPTYGWGATAVIGYKSLFAAVDANFTRSDLDLLDAAISKKTVTIRSGLQGRLGLLKGAVWAGAMYVDRRTRLEGTLLSGTALDPIRFEVEQEFADPWNFILGATWEASPTLNFTVEGGLGSRQQITAAVGLRL